MEVATKVATWGTIALLGFFVSTVLSLDKNYGIMAVSVENGFKTQGATLARIERKQSENSKTIADHEVRLTSIEATRFTDEDSRELLASFAVTVSGMDTKIQDIWKAIADMREKIPYDIVQKLEGDLRLMQTQADKLRDRLSDHEHGK